MGALVALDDDLWLMEGPRVKAYGVWFPTRMAVARLSGGALWVWSPIRLDDQVRRAIAAIGEPRFAVEPNKLHHLALADWAATWPEMQLFAPPGLARKRPDLRFVAELGDQAPPPWRDEIDQVCVGGSVVLTEVFFFHRRSSTCLVGDLIQKHDARAATPWRRLLLRASGVLGKDGSTPRDARLTFFRRDLARQAVLRAVSWAPRRLVIAHGACSFEDGAAELRRSMQWLLRGARPRRAPMSGIAPERPARDLR